MAATADPRKDAGTENKPQGVINKVATLPLVSTAYEMASATYSSAKESHPAIHAVCDMAETGVKTMATSVAAANSYACKGLDKLQTVGKVVLDTKDLVVGAKDSIYSKVTEVKDVMSSMVGVAKETTQESMKTAKSAVTSGVSTVMETSLAMVTSGVDKVIEKYEELVDHYLPITDEELVSLAASLQWDDSAMVLVEKHKRQQSYYVQLGSLSTKVGGRAYHHSLEKLQKAKLSSQEVLVQLQQAIDSMKHAKEVVNQKIQDSQEKLKEIWQIWKKNQPVEQNGTNGEIVAETDSKALILSHSLAEKLHAICQNLLVDVQGLPVALKEKMKQTHSNMEDLQVAFSRAQSFQDISNNLLAQSKETLVKAQETVNEFRDFVSGGSPRSWVAGPCSPEKLTEPKEEVQK